MNSVLILLDSLNDWKPYCETSSVLTVSDYLKQQSLGRESRLVINLSGDYAYNSEGYYCSLLAQARGHKILPGVETINKLEAGAGVRMDRTLQRLCYQWIQKNRPEGETWYLHIYFGRCREKGLEKIARFLFEHYPCPLLRVGFNTRSRNQIESVQFLGLSQLNDEEQDFFADSLDYFNKKVWRTPRSPKSFRYSLAILHDPLETFPPSNKKALNKFLEMAKKMNINAELITEEDSARLMEFDSLFIRCTTALNHVTFHLSQKASLSDMVVIDDPLSIIRCTNKVYLSELLEREKIPAPASRLIFRSNRNSFESIGEQLGAPFVVKIPDGSFSHGMKKVTCEEELQEVLSVLFEKSAILLAQEYTPTEFDWRIGILNGEALFACKYYMAKGHWQIYNHADPGKNRSGLVDTIPIYQVPQHVLKTALKAASLIGKGLYGVDLKVINDKAVVIEINDNPSIDHGIEDAILGDELYYRILNYFVRTMEIKYR
ncbi:MAG: RimK family protein [Culturomica sp.]|jgi:glutathione synthase/RimK-type ligase-like ATP-grasp enzyme|nr:RimK family protein [Culturomica sp.]